jgi:chaperonin GroES
LAMGMRQSVLAGTLPIGVFLTCRYDVSPPEKHSGRLQRKAHGLFGHHVCERSNDMKVQPLGDKVLVKRVEAATKTKGGIYLPESAKEKPQEATVVATGEGHRLKDGTKVPLAVKKGDRVLISKWGGTEIKIESQEMLVLSEDDILAVLE